MNSKRLVVGTTALVICACSSGAKDDQEQGVEAGVEDSDGSASACPSQAVSHRPLGQALIVTDPPLFTEETGDIAAGTVTEIGSDQTILDDQNNPIPNWYMAVAGEGGSRKVSVVGWDDSTSVKVGDTVAVTLAINTGNGVNSPYIQSASVRSGSGELMFWAAQNITEEENTTSRPIVPPELSWGRADSVCPANVARCQTTQRYKVSVTIGADTVTLDANQSAQLGDYEARTLDTEFVIPTSSDPFGCEGQVWEFILGVFKKPSP